jgi:nucleotide-binding universal stress UspA family protein
MLGKKILVPLDGLPTSEAALPYAEALARRTRGTLVLVRAARAPLLSAPPEQVQVIREAETYLAALADQVASRGLTVETGVPYGPASSWILGEIELRDADLVVMATHDRTGPDRWVHGSVAETVVSRAAVPVMVVRETAPVLASRLEKARPVLVVPLDGSDLAEAAVAIASRLAALLDGTITLVGVVPRPGQLVYAEGVGVPFGAQESKRLQADSKDYLASMAGHLGNEYVTEALVRLGDPAPEIARLADERGAAAVVMATHGRTGLARMLLGSVAGQVVHTGQAPVVLVRPATMRPAEVPITSQQMFASLAP